MNPRQTRLILIGAAVLMRLGMGMRQCLGLFRPRVPGALALRGGVFPPPVAVKNIVGGVSRAPVGAIADLFGLRATMRAGAAFYFAGLAVMAVAGGEPP